jgi:PPM family protein phosphatase
MITVTSAVLSHPGLRREANEDTVCARPDLGLFLVADGMGGHAAGEVASRIAAQAIEMFINDTRDADVNTTWPFPYNANLSLDGNRLTAAFKLANRKLTLAMQEDESLRTMATTAAALLINKGTPVVAHVGDSRLYRWREGTLVQVTQDHSWVTEQVRAGVLTETDAKSHPWRHVVTRALSGGEDPEIEITNVEIRPGDRILICSDGLSGVVPVDRLSEILGRMDPLEDTCRALVDAANQAGGPDNVTVAVLQVEPA